MNTTNLLVGFGRPWTWDEAAWYAFGIVAAWGVVIAVIDWYRHK